MSDIQNQIDLLKTNNEADAATLAALEADLATPPSSESVGDQALAAVVPVVTNAGLVSVFGADALVSALQDKGYVITAPQA